jgi:hypothetical protein
VRQSTANLLDEMAGAPDILYPGLLLVKNVYLLYEGAEYGVQARQPQLCCQVFHYIQHLPISRKETHHYFSIYNPVLRTGCYPGYKNSNIREGREKKNLLSYLFL